MAKTAAKLPVFSKTGQQLFQSGLFSDITIVIKEIDFEREAEWEVDRASAPPGHSGFLLSLPFLQASIHF